MLSDYKQDEFEDFLKQSADGLRMYPSDKVWNRVSHSLKEKRRKTGFISAGFFLLSSLLGYFLIENKNVVKPLATKAVAQASAAYASRQPLLKIARRQNELQAAPIVSSETVEVEKEILPSQNAVIRQLYPPEVRPEKEAKDLAIADEAVLPGAKTPELFQSPVDDSFADGVENSRTTTGEELTKATDLSTTDQLLTIESVTNSFQRTSKRSKTSFQFFFTPTVSYRKLAENKSYLQATPQYNASLNYAVLYNINDAVTHKPDLGLEVGFAAKYPVTRDLKLRAGLQFNMTRYAIKAFTYPTEVAQIALNNSNYVGSSTNYRNFGGGRADWLQNMYFQLSAPVGGEIRLAGNSKTSFGVASTIQPTYVLGDRAYMISTDYKNYTEVPWLMRKWNVNTSFETFVAYSTGKMNWQVGPQVRYQLLSSFVTEYPVKEHLFDFGLKVGVSLNNDKKSSDNDR